MDKLSEEQRKRLNILLKEERLKRLEKMEEYIAKKDLKLYNELNNTNKEQHTCKYCERKDKDIKTKNIIIINE